MVHSIFAAFFHAMFGSAERAAFSLRALLWLACAGAIAWTLDSLLTHFRPEHLVFTAVGFAFLLIAIADYQTRPSKSKAPKGRQG